MWEKEKKKGFPFDPPEKKQEVTHPDFMGLPIEENKYIPKGQAVVADTGAGKKMLFNGELEDILSSKELNDLLAGARHNAGEKLSKKLDEEILKGLGVSKDYLHPSTNASASALTKEELGQITKLSGSLSGKDGYASVGAIDQSYNMEPKIDIDHLMRNLPTERILRTLLQKQGRMPKKESFYKDVIDYMIRQSVSTMHPEYPHKEGEIVDWLDVMSMELKLIPGVKSVTTLIDDYPESVSLILKVDMSSFEDDEVIEGMQEIEKTIQTYKPKQLKELEVIYHNKVVYE